MPGFKLLLNVSHLHLVQIGSLVHCLLQAPLLVVSALADPNLLIGLQLDLPLLYSEVRGGLLLQLELISELVEVLLGVGLQLQLHIPLRLLHILQLLPLRSLVLDLLLLDFFYDVFELVLEQLVDSGG